MTDPHFEGKRIPLEHFEEYLTLHHENIVKLQINLAEKILDKPAIERLLPKPMYLIHSHLTRLLRDNGVLHSNFNG